MRGHLNTYLGTFASVRRFVSNGRYGFLATAPDAHPVGCASAP